MLAIVITALGAALCASGFMFIGIAHSIQGGNDALWTAGWVLLIGGAIATLSGSFWYRAAEARMAAQRRSIN
jgi:hypothetical protein